MESSFEKSVLEFSLPLYQALEKNGNAFMSPYSVSAALMLLLLGTDGETKAELETALKVHGDKAHLGYSLLQKELTDKSNEGVLIAIANRIFSKQGMAVKKTFSTGAMQYYGSELEMLDFENQAEESRMKINFWIEEQTKNKIKDLIPSGILNSYTMMVLANAIYFKGDWDLKFDKGRTLQENFFVNENDSVKVDMMSDKRKVMYGESPDLEFKCLLLPYKGDTLSMLILLPNERTGLEALESKLTVSLLQDTISSVIKQETIIKMPKFRIEAPYDLTKSLPKLGISRIFSRGADFTGIFEDGGHNVYVSDFIHKAFVEVNEEGTEAAAATASVGSARMAPFEFTADHPFMFFIRDNKSGTVLFIGRFTSPN